MVTGAPVKRKTARGYCTRLYKRRAGSAVLPFLAERKISNLHVISQPFSFKSIRPHHALKRIYLGSVR